MYFCSFACGTKISENYKYLKRELVKAKHHTITNYTLSLLWYIMRITCKVPSWFRHIGASELDTKKISSTSQVISTQNIYLQNVDYGEIMLEFQHIKIFFPSLRPPLPASCGPENNTLFFKIKSLIKNLTSLKIHYLLNAYS